MPPVCLANDSLISNAYAQYMGGHHFDRNKVGFALTGVVSSAVELNAKSHVFDGFNPMADFGFHDARLLR